MLPTMVLVLLCVFEDRLCLAANASTRVLPEHGVPLFGADRAACHGGHCLDAAKAATAIP
jgi:hypothetical protein